MAIYAVDFDGTLAVTRFPEIVEPKRKIVAAVKMLKANGSPAGSARRYYS